VNNLENAQITVDIFEDYEAKSNLVGAFSILLKVYQRNPQLYEETKNPPNSGFLDENKKSSQTLKLD